jgi:hypothetical protein
MKIANELLVAAAMLAICNGIKAQKNMTLTNRAAGAGFYCSLRS